MTALALVEAPGGSVDPLTARLDELLFELGVAVRDDDVGCADGVRVDRVASLERLRSAVVALQVAESVRFARSQTALQMVQGVDPRVVGRGVADQLALACGVSPFTGSRRLGVARALWFDLPETFGLLTAGEVSEQVAEAVVSETRHLDAVTRRRVDAELVGDGIGGLSVRRAIALARRVAYAADPVAYVARGRTERKSRRVGCRAAPDTMSFVSGFVPVEQGVACLAALRAEAEARLAAGDSRSRDQVMADAFVERLTGQVRAQDVNVEVQVVVPWEVLVDPADPGAGFVDGELVPGEIVRDVLASTRGRVWWRRLFTMPASGAWFGGCAPEGQAGTPQGQAGTPSSSSSGGRSVVVGGDRVRRRFDGWLAAMVRARDQRCRDPFCDAPVRHIDHIVRFADGGSTTVENGRGVCARGNYVREMPGWRVEVVDGGVRGSPHTVRTTTPTGHVYESRAPDPP